MKTNLLKTFLLLVILLGSYKFSKADILFEDNFNSQADWQPRPATNDVAPAGSTAYTSLSGSNGSWGMPNGWSYFRATGLWWGPTYQDSIRITSQADVDDNGKALVIYNEANNGSSGDGWGSDALLYKLFPADYNELYFRFKFKTQAGWQWATNNDMMIKIMRALHFDRTGEPFVFFSNGDSGPYWVWDFKHSNTYGVRYSQIAHPDPQADFSAVAAISNDGTLTGGNSAIEPNAPGQLADGAWHTLDFHVRMNSYTSAWNSDGILEFSIDGVQKFSVLNARWKETVSPFELGWNAFALGGNAFNSYNNSWIKNYTYSLNDTVTYNSYNWKAIQEHLSADSNRPGYTSSAYWQNMGLIAGQKEQWYAIDDVVVSETVIPDDYVIGGNVVAPSAPSGLSVE